jgi:hypothetical protein
VHESDSGMSDSTVFTVDTEEGNHSYYVDLREAIEPPAHLLEQHRVIRREYRRLHGATHHYTRQFTVVRNVLHANIRMRARTEFIPDIAIVTGSYKSERQDTIYDSADDFELEQKLSDTSKRARAVQNELRDLLEEVEGRRVKAWGKPAGVRVHDSSTSYSPTTTPPKRQHTRAEGRGLSPSKSKALKRRRQTGMMAKLLQHQERADVPTHTQTRSAEEESDSDDENHVIALISSVGSSTKAARRRARDELELCFDSGSRLHVETRVLESLVTFVVPNDNNRLILRGIEGADMPITHTGYIPGRGTFVACKGANACLLSVRELIREGHHVSFTLSGAIIRGREGGNINGYTRTNGLTFVLRADLQILESNNPTGVPPPTPDNDYVSHSAHTHTI